MSRSWFICVLGYFLVVSSRPAEVHARPQVQRHLSNCLNFLTRGYWGSAILPPISGLGTFGQPFARTIEGLKRELGEVKRNQIAQLPPNALWFDGGSGLGIAQLQTALAQNIRTVAVSKDNFWRELRRGGRFSHRHVRWDASGTRPIQMGTWGKEFLTGLAPTFEEFGVWTPDLGYRVLDEDGRLLLTFRDQSEALPTVKFGIRTLRAMRMKAEALGRFGYFVETVEDYLSEEAERADLITDIYGAAWYGIDVPRLLTLYYSHLKPGAEAWVVWGDVVGISVRHKVTLPDGQVMGLGEYLTAHYPTIFSIDHKVLTIRRDSRIEDLDLRLICNPDSITFNENGRPTSVLWWPFQRIGQ